VEAGQKSLVRCAVRQRLTGAAQHDSTGGRRDTERLPGMSWGYRKRRIDHNATAELLASLPSV
jgi:hypothetical protein